MMTPQQRQGSKPQSGQKRRVGQADDRPAAQFLPPFKAHPWLAVITGIILLAWLVLLVVLRLTTVHRGAEPAPAPAQTSTQM